MQSSFMPDQVAHARESQNDQKKSCSNNSFYNVTWTLSQSCHQRHGHEWAERELKLPRCTKSQRRFQTIQNFTTLVVTKWFSRWDWPKPGLQPKAHDQKFTIILFICLKRLRGWFWSRGIFSSLPSNQFKPSFSVGKFFNATY